MIEIHLHAAANTVQHFREIREQPIIGRTLIVEGRQHQYARAAGIARMLGEFHAIHQAGAARARHHARRRNAARNQPFQNGLAFMQAEGICLTGRAQHAKPGAAIGQQPFGMRRHAIQIGGQIGLHRRQHGSVHAAINRILHQGHPSQSLNKICAP